jgi:FtsH-binding integral membrane protein
MGNVDILGVSGVLLGFMFYAYYTKIPIAFLITSVIAFGSSLYMFNATGNQQCACGIYAGAFLVVGIWQLGEVVRYYFKS